VQLGPDSPKESFKALQLPRHLPHRLGCRGCSGEGHSGREPRSPPAAHALRPALGDVFTLSPFGAPPSYRTSALWVSHYTPPPPFSQIPNSAWSRRPHIRRPLSAVSVLGGNRMAYHHRSTECTWPHNAKAASWVSPSSYAPSPTALTNTCLSSIR
jgi:hypothetical protein